MTTPIPGPVWDRIKDAIRAGRNVDIAIAVRDGVVTDAAFTERVHCEPPPPAPAPPPAAAPAE